ncbi:MAG: T9SS type A sorting domain-containing protein [Bacteroidetes bacterium]|nr:T9SS type A sorting domain-containing protein [Bacteroidota bacterium]
MKKLLFISIFTLTFFMYNNTYASLLSVEKGVKIEQQTPTIVDIVASPNPFSVKTTIYFNSIKEQEVTFTIKNLLGKTVFTQKLNVSKGENNIEFFKNDLNPGMYLYSLQTTNEIISKRLVIK